MNLSFSNIFAKININKPSHKILLLALLLYKNLLLIFFVVKMDCSYLKGEQRQTMLEKAVSEAQSSESRVQNFQQWIYHVDELLNEHIDNDTTVEDLPHDFQVSAVIHISIILANKIEA